MRVLFTSFAMETHFLSMVPLAWAMRTAGHEVRVASQPGLTRAITAAGLTAVPVGEDHGLLDAVLGVSDGADGSWNSVDLDPARPEVHSWEFLKAINGILPERFFAQANNDSMVDGMVEFATSWRPDLVVWEPFTVAGAIAARAVGAAHARLLWGADLLIDLRARFLSQLAERPAGAAHDALGDWLGGLLDRYGLDFHETVVRGQWTIDTLPSSIRMPLGEPTVPVRYVPYNGPAVVPDWLRVPPARTRVCLTLGLTARDGADYLLGSLDGLFDAVGDLDVEIVATLNAAQREQVSRLPDNVRAVDFVPLHALLPTCSAVAHHCGAGTWSTAAYHGVPQLISPMVFENSYRARRTAEVGAALVIPQSELTPQALRDGLLRVLTEPRFAEGADRLRRESMSDPTPNDVVPTLEKLTLQHRDLDA
ncbi:activator-dependent family glycosyltransferase [Micromonospora sp. NPDC048935]|uniref:activator-dependent family glycosyltransferase n=1 Tax=Micromonospora sp. NPDC048935 TaxID=3364262 RepID=UPI0037163F7A